MARSAGTVARREAAERVAEQSPARQSPEQLAEGWRGAEAAANEAYSTAMTPHPTPAAADEAWAAYSRLAHVAADAFARALAARGPADAARAKELLGQYYADLARRQRLAGRSIGRPEGDDDRIVPRHGRVPPLQDWRDEG